MGMDSTLWTTAELANFLQLPVGTLYQWHHRGEGPTALRIGRHLRYRASDLRAWLDTRVDP